MRAALDALDSRPVVSPALHARLAQVAESVGDLDRAVLEYNLSLKAEPDQPAVLWRLAHLRLDQGQTDRAVRCLRRLLEAVPTHEEARELLARTLADSGAVPSAVLTANEAGTPRFSELARELANRRARAEPSEEPASAATAPRVPTEADVLTFVMAFSAREGVYARQWASPTGKAGYTPIHQPFTPQVARHHLLGDYTVGLYAVRRDNTVRWLAIDLDIASAELRKARDASTLTRLTKAVHKASLTIVDACAKVGLDALLEDSGHKGRHVWVLFEEPIPAGAAKRIGEWLVESAGELPGEVTAEVFPKQAKVTSADGLGNLIKLPLGVHQLSGRRCELLRAAGGLSRDPFGDLARARRAERAQLSELFARVKGSAPASVLMPEPAPAEGLSLVPADPPYSLAQDAEVSWLRARCAVLDYLVDQASSTHLLSNPERAVVTYTVGHLTSGARAVNAVFDGVMNVEASALLKSPLRGHPMSCPKIRARLPEISARVGCNCSFDAIASYPHPLLHLESLRARATLEQAPDEVSPAATERLVRDWVKLRADLERLAKLGSELESQLLAVVAARGSLSTAAGTLSVVGSKLELTPPAEPPCAPASGPTK
ncbi:MAG: tetratricopeptide repeat protein [Deltaproteobacteria bacterium]|nr:tetratricopeptide repeat protein [Deltaproteobacteria bacterium]